MQIVPIQHLVVLRPVLRERMVVLYPGTERAYGGPRVRRGLGRGLAVGSNAGCDERERAVSYTHLRAHETEADL
eukprot:1699530-Rhodomonas_salina.1